MCKLLYRGAKTLRGRKDTPFRIDATAVNTGLDWTTVTTEKLADMAAIVNQEQ